MLKERIFEAHTAIQALFFCDAIAIVVFTSGAATQHRDL